MAASKKSRSETRVETPTAAAALRKSASRSAEKVHAFLVEQVATSSGARRVLLVSDEPGALRIAGSLLPPGEAAGALLRAITPWMDESRRQRGVRLRRGPRGAKAIDQRCCMVVPLRVQDQLLGFLYADVEGAFGRFTQSDRDRFTEFAAAAAEALNDARWLNGMQREMTERAGQLEARERELELINSKA